MRTHLPYDAPGHVRSVLPVPTTLPERALLIIVPTDARTSMPLWPRPLYNWGWALEKSVLPKYCVIDGLSTGHFKTPLPTLGKFLGSMANLSFDSYSNNSRSKASRKAIFWLRIRS